MILKFRWRKCSASRHVAEKMLNTMEKIITVVGNDRGIIARVTNGDNKNFTLPKHHQQRLFNMMHSHYPGKDSAFLESLMDEGKETFS